MNILAIDTAGPYCSVMLYAAGNEYFRSENSSRQHSRHILRMIECVLLDAKMNMDDISLLAWNAGPGSFTGLRIGASVVQALSYSHQLPVLSLSSLKLLAHNASKNIGTRSPEPLVIAVAVNAQMSGVYWASFVWQEGELRRLEPDQLLSKDEVADRQQQLTDVCQLVGDGWQDAVSGNTTEISAADVMAVSLIARAEQWLNNPTECLPNYVHNSINWQKRQFKRSV